MTPRKISRFAVARAVPRLAGRLPGVASRVLEHVLASPELDGEKAEELALEAWRKAEDVARRDLLRVEIAGDDLVDERTEELVVRLIGRLGFRLSELYRSQGDGR